MKVQQSAVVVQQVDQLYLGNISHFMGAVGGHGGIFEKGLPSLQTLLCMELVGKLHLDT